jgi:hypothetical protein
LEFEVLVVDNASTDGSRKMVKAKYPAVKLLENPENTGFAAANNKALRMAGGKYVILLNNDTELKNNAFKLMVDFMDQHAGVGILTCKLFEADGRIQKNCRSFPVTPFDTFFARASLFSRLFPNNPISRKNLVSDWDYNSRREVDWVSGAAMLINKRVIDQIGGLDELYYMYWEDTDYCKRARDKGWKIMFLPAAEIIHYTGSGGTKQSTLFNVLKMIYHKHRSAYLYFLKFHYKNPSHPMALFTYAGMLFLVAIKSADKIARVWVQKYLRS